MFWVVSGIILYGIILWSLYTAYIMRTNLILGKLRCSLVVNHGQLWMLKQHQQKGKCIALEIRFHQQGCWAWQRVIQCNIFQCEAPFALNEYLPLFSLPAN